MEFLSILGLFGCTLFFHNGFSPIFSVMKESRQGTHIKRAPVFLFFGAKLLFDAVTGVLPFTILQYPCYYCAWVLAEKSALLSATVFYLTSNSVCWMSMSPTPFCPNPNFCIYAGDVSGWVTCLVAGLPYYINSLAATVVFSLAFKLIKEQVRLYSSIFSFRRFYA